MVTKRRKQRLQFKMEKTQQNLNQKMIKHVTYVTLKNTKIIKFRKNHRERKKENNLPFIKKYVFQKKNNKKEKPYI